jgi:glutathione synthase/RimK-type ligase-like ATP-grasp enzyme
MIVVCGGIADGVTELVCARLEHRGVPYRLLDLGVFPAGFALHCRWSDGRTPEGWLAGPDWRVDLADISGIFVRYPGEDARIAPPDTAEQQAQLYHAETDLGLAALLEDVSCTVINRANGAMSNHSKPYQALLIREAGLLVPPTLVTNDPARAAAFIAEADGDVIYKSLSGVRSIVRRPGPDQLRRLHLLEHAPAQFQRFIPGDNVRVHTVGDRLFATEVRTEAVDYRYAARDGLSIEMVEVALPPAVEEACFALTATLGLVIAGIDLKRTPDGEYYCFEINPAPGFLYYEQHSGQPISDAVVDVLAGDGAAPPAFDRFRATRDGADSAARRTAASAAP